MFLFFFFSINKEHAIITVKDNTVSIKAGTPGAKIKINGVLMAGDSMQLKHNDRLLFGR